MFLWVFSITVESANTLNQTKVGTSLSSILFFLLFFLIKKLSYKVYNVVCTKESSNDSFLVDLGCE